MYPATSPSFLMCRRAHAEKPRSSANPRERSNDDPLVVAAPLRRRKCASWLARPGARRHAGRPNPVGPVAPRPPGGRSARRLGHPHGGCVAVCGCVFPLTKEELHLNPQGVKGKTPQDQVLTPSPLTHNEKIIPSPGHARFQRRRCLKHALIQSCHCPPVDALQSLGSGLSNPFNMSK